MLETIVGGILAILGGFAATVYQSRNTLKNRIAELTAERKVAVNGEAYNHIKTIEGATRAPIAEALQKVEALNEWFFSNRLYLPGKFPDYWLAIRGDVRTLERLDRTGTDDPERATEIDERLARNIREAIAEICEDAGLPRSDFPALQQLVHPTADGR